jgi:hypothetical protein
MLGGTAVRIYLYVILSYFLRLPPFAPIEREIENRLREKSETLEDISLTIHGTRWGFLRGRIQRLEVILHGLNTAPGLRLDRFDILAENVSVAPWQTFFRDNPVLRAVDSVTWTVTLREDDLERFFAARGPLLRGIKVSISEEGILLERTLGGLAGALLDIHDPFRLGGRFHVQKSNIHLDLQRLNAFGLAPNQTLLKTVLTLINPVVRAADINRMLRRADIRVLRGHKLHNVFHDIRNSPGFAEIRGELMVMPGAPAPDGSD